MAPKLPAFDPFGWLAAWLPESFLHRALNALLAALFAWLIYARLELYPVTASKLEWWEQTIALACFGFVYAVRTSPKRRSRGAVEIVVPLIAACFPIIWVQRSDGGGWLGEPPALPLGSELLLLGGFLASAGVLTLGRSFSLTPEARELKTRGLYRFVRHPIYLGEIIACLGTALLGWSWLSGACWLVFVALQIWRARLEEAKLAGLPGYAAYRARTGFMLPRLTLRAS